MDIAILDERPGSPLESVGCARFNRPRITVRELIAARVALEIESATERNVFAGAGVGADPVAERLNGAPSDDGEARLQRMIDDAENGFVRGRYFLLAGDRQLQSLDEEIDLAGTSEATFLLLTPLQGG